MKGKRRGVIPQTVMEGKESQAEKTDGEDIKGDGDRSLKRREIRTYLISKKNKNDAQAVGKT